MALPDTSSEAAIDELKASDWVYEYIWVGSQFSEFRSISSRVRTQDRYGPYRFNRISNGDRVTNKCGSLTIDGQLRRHDIGRC